MMRTGAGQRGLAVTNNLEEYTLDQLFARKRGDERYLVYRGKDGKLHPLNSDMQMFVIDYAAYGEKPHGPYAARQIAENLGKLKEAESARNREAERVNRAVRRSNEQLGCILNFDGPFEDPGRKLV